MTPKIFATGTTGYLGGTVLHSILTTHPDWESNITCLVRSPSRSIPLSSTYPSLTLVSGTLEDSELLENEAAKADIVLHFASSDHVGGAEAIKAGMLKGRGGYWIHTSGTDILLKPELLDATRIEEVRRVNVYDDWDGVGEVTSFSKDHSHRPCDMVPLSISSDKIKTAIVCPPTIFAAGRGSGSTRSIQIYELARLTLERGRGFIIPGEKEGNGKCFWPNIHIDDLTRVYMEVIESAAAELAGKKGKATWGWEGYYFADNGIHYWQDVTDAIAEEAHKQGFLKSAAVTNLVEGEKDLLKAVGPAIWNTGASYKSVRVKKLFGWEPEEKELMTEIAEIVRSEAERAGMTKTN